MKLRTKSETQALRQRVAKIQEQRGGVSVADLAKDAGVAYSVLYYLLNGVKKRMQAANYDQIVAWLERVETPSPPNAVDADLDLRAELASFKAKLARHYKVSPEEVTIFILVSMTFPARVRGVDVVAGEGPPGSALASAPFGRYAGRRGKRCALWPRRGPAPGV